MTDKNSEPGEKMNTECARFEIFRGRELNGKLSNLRLSGYAFLRDGENFYRVRLLLFPEMTYYLSRNQGAGYTLFSKMVIREDGSHVFQNPVGFARLMDSVKTHLYVRFPDLGSHMYMNLYPAASTDAVQA